MYRGQHSVFRTSGGGAVRHGNVMLTTKACIGRSCLKRSPDMGSVWTFTTRYISFQSVSTVHYSTVQGALTGLEMLSEI